jgi:hypothetical protein
MLFAFAHQLAWLFLQQQRHQQALEAAALAAASDLSQVVVNDPYFGFISLTDRPAVGRATRAEDGEPLPVRGINTIIATARLDYLVASELGNAKMQEFAVEDAQHAREAIERLNKALDDALKEKPKEIPLDMDGNRVRPYQDSFNVYQDSLAKFTKAPPKEFKLSIGWLRKSGATVTPVPVSSSKSQTKVKDPYVPDGGEINGCYRSSVDLTVGNERFYLASLGKQPSLVSASEFVGSDTSHINSIVQVQAVCDVPSFLPWDNSTHTIKGQACSEAYAMDSQPAPSVLVMAFPDGRPSGINSLHDILSSRGLDGALMKVYRPIKGDFPVDPQCELRASDNNLAECTASTIIARGFHDWLRSNYTLPKIDSLLEAINQSLATASNSNIFVVEITDQGKAVVSALRRNPFEDLRIAESQLYGINSQPVAIGSNNWTLVCRDEVYAAGTTTGGKHAGQPMAGNPINWAELNSYVDDTFAAAAATRRPGGITISGDRQPGGGIALPGVHLELDNKQAANRDIRTSNCSAGLASEIRISSPTAPN